MTELAFFVNYPFKKFLLATKQNHSECYLFSLLSYCEVFHNLFEHCFEKALGLSISDMSTTVA